MTKSLLAVLGVGVVGLGALAGSYALPTLVSQYSRPSLPVAPSLGRPVGGDEITTSVDFYDSDAFIKSFEAGDPRVDLNGDGFVDFYDIDEFIKTHESNCF